MIVKYRKSFFNDVQRIVKLKHVNDIEFITELAKDTATPDGIPGFKWLRQYPNMARIETAPFRIGVEVNGNSIIFKRVLPRSVFYLQFP